jgi:hypothetical protein
MTTPHDRRGGTGMTEFEDGNGKTVTVYTFSIARWKTWAAFISALVTIGLTVFGAVQAGVEIQVQREITNQIREPLSPLNMHIGVMVDHAADLRDISEAPMHATQIQEITALKIGQAQRQEQIDGLRIDLVEMRSDIKELLRRVR